MWLIKLVRNLILTRHYVLLLYNVIMLNVIMVNFNLFNVIMPNCIMYNVTELSFWRASQSLKSASECHCTKSHGAPAPVSSDFERGDCCPVQFSSCVVMQKNENENENGWEIISLKKMSQQLFFEMAADTIVLKGVSVLL